MMSVEAEGAPYDVAIVGYGPVGQALALMLAEQGHRIVVTERWPELFPLPRAGHVDHEVMRILQSLGVAAAIEEDSWKLSGYQLRDSEGEVLHNFDWGHEGLSGWYSDYSLFQPQLEGLMHAAIEAHPGVELLRGWQAERVAQTGDTVEIDVRHGAAADGVWAPGQEGRTLRARYVVGCDGANSVVRETFGIEMSDFGFEADWLVVFAEPSDPTLQVDMPDVAQLLDPRRPTTAFRSSGKRFCRWEFMLMPGETPEAMSTPEVAWELIERWGLTPENSRLIRNTVFRFRSLVADRWRADRALIAGDAAHLMPPFLGQGMCSGLRDAKTLSWKLDLILKGLAEERLLDTYEEERRPHVAAIVEASLRLGEMISITDPVAASERDTFLREGSISPPEEMPGLERGVLLRDETGAPRGRAGELTPQGRVDDGGRTDRFDEIVGRGWVVITTGWDARAEIGPNAGGRLDLLDAHVVRIEAAADGEGALGDVDSVYLPWLRELGASAAIVRPDFYLFGCASDPDQLDEALLLLAEQLTLTQAAAASEGASASG